MKVLWGMENVDWTTCKSQPVAAIKLSTSLACFSGDKNDLPHWVNDSLVLNANTVLDAFPLPWVDDILADCAQGTIWSKLDMTNSFFQTLMKPEDVWKTAMTTHFGLYEWIVMLMGLHNSPLTHQWWVMAALWPLIGKFVTCILIMSWFGQKL